MLALAVVFSAAAAAASGGGECHFEVDTAYEQPAAGDDWRHDVDTTSAGECCAICRSLPECHVGNYVHSSKPPSRQGGNWFIAGRCYMRGKVDLTKPTIKPNVTACVVGTRPAPVQPPPPGARNVLYMVSDDCRPELPNYGQDYIHAPNLAKLAARGLTFMHAYCQQSICSPSRNSFMSGRKPQITRVWNFVNDFRQELPFALSFPQYFKMHGYSTFGHSKLYHPTHPSNYDEPLSWSQLPADANPKDGNFSQYWYPGDGAGPLGSPPFLQPHQPSGCGYFDVCPTSLSREHFMDYCTATKAIERMEYVAKLAKPFFLGVGLIRPHLPFVVPEDMWGMYDHAKIELPASTAPPINHVDISLNDQIFSGNKTFCPSGPDSNTSCFSRERPSIPTTDGVTPFHPESPATIRFLRHGYYAAVSFMDEQVGRLVDHLDTVKQTENTIVIFHGDHGWHLGEQGLWTKKTNFELGTRVPLIIAAPHLTASHGQRTLQLAELLDVYPTVAALAGLPQPPELDGTSLLGAFLSPANPGHDPSLANKTHAFSEFPQCPGIHPKFGGPAAQPLTNLWHTDEGCQSVLRENIGFFGFSVRSKDWRYTEWHPWNGQALKADWETMTGVELYDYRTVDMTDFDQFDRVNVAGVEHKDVQAELSAALRANYDKM